MTKENFNRIMAGLEEARRHAAGEDVPGMVIHRPKPKGWVDPDDAPEWSDDVFDRAEIRDGDDVVRKATGTLTKPGSEP